MTLPQDPSGCFPKSPYPSTGATHPSIPPGVECGRKAVNVETQGEVSGKGSTCFHGRTTNQRGEGLGRGAWWWWLMGQKWVGRGNPCSGPGSHLSGLATRYRGLRSPAHCLPWGWWPASSLQVQVPQAGQHPWALKELTSPTAADTQGGGCSPSRLAYHTGPSREERGAENSLCELCEWRPPLPYRHRTENGTQRLPGPEPAPWHLSRGICAGEHRAVGARPVRERFYALHVTAGNPAPISSFKRHLKYSLGEAEAKYGTACERPVWTF